MKTKYFFVSLAVFAFALFAFEANAGIFQFSETDPKYLQALSIAAAQEAQKEIDIGKKLELDEDLKPEDFGLTDVGILPTNPFYFVKSIRRGVGSLFTRDPAAKAELRMQYAAEKLLEAKEVAQKEDSSDKDKKYAIENFKDELEEVKHRVEVASESLEGDEAKELSRKVLDSSLKYGKSLGNIEKNVSPELFLHVKEAKDAASDALASTFGLVEPEVVSNQITEVLDKQVGSEFKDFKNLEVLKEVEAKVPENAKDAIKNAQENALNKLQSELEKLEFAKKAIFEEFIKSAGGSEIRHLEIINELEARPISKELRNVILGAKENVFSKAETRLNGLSQENKEKFAEHLGEGNIEDFRTLRELQNNIDSGVISGISGVASRAETEFVKKIKSTEQNDAQKKEFLGSIERFHDAKSISVLNEIEKLIPEDKRAFFGELKSKAVQEIKNDIGRATNSSQRQSVYDSLAGDHPEDFAALDKFQGTVRTPFDVSIFVEGIKRAQYGAMQDKIENISNKERLAKYEEEFKKLGQEIPDYFVFRKAFEQQKNIFKSPEKALKKIEEAEKALAEFREAKSALPIDLAYKGGEFDYVLRDIESVFAYAERKLETARTVLAYNDIGRAFGEAQSAENMARDGIALVAKYKSGVKETKCPFYYPPPASFCAGGVTFFQNDQNGCPLPPRCEFRESNECPVVDYAKQIACASGTHRETSKDEKGCFTLGKCVDDKVTCQAYFEGYVLEKDTNTCRKESVGGCTDPFVYHTLEECTKSKNQVTVCPALPTVTSCLAGEHKVATYSSKECGTYYTCEKDITITTPQCSDGKDNDNDGQIDYPADTGCYGKEDNDEAYYPTTEPYCRSYTTEATCKASSCVWYLNHNDGTHCDDKAHGSTVSTSNWVEHFWKFKDGLTEKSMILNRTDSEYLAFISGVEKQCLGITKDKFAWKSGAGNDSTENWQNFGIPDCSGTVTTSTTCTSPSTCFDSAKCTSSGWHWYNSGCWSSPQTTATTTTSTTPACTPAFACTTVDTCTASGFYWYNGTCRESKPVSGTCAYAADYCVNETECLSNKYYWCRDDCYGSATACPTTTNSCSGLGSGWTIYGLYCLDSTRTHYTPLNSAITSSIQSCAAADLPVTGCASAPSTTTTNTTTTTTTTTGTCSTASSCTTQSNCTASHFFWYDGACHTSQTTTTTTTTTTSTCSQSLTALLGTGCHQMYTDSSGKQVYCDGAMTKSAKEGDTTTTSGCQSGGTTTNTTTSSCTTASTCTNSTSCAGSGFYWYNNVCNTSMQTTTTTTTSNCSTPANCFDQSVCTSSGWFWYNSGCWSTSQSSSNTSCPYGYYWTGTACAINPSSVTACTSDQYWNGTACVANTTTTTTSCVTCANPGSGCWYEGGSCSTCGTVKCSTTTTTTACNNNGVCDSGESASSCSSDCHTTTTTYTGGANVLQSFWNKLLGF